MFYSWVSLSPVLIKSQQPVSKDKATMKWRKSSNFLDTSVTIAVDVKVFSMSKLFHFILILSATFIQLVREKKQ